MSYRSFLANVEVQCQCFLQASSGINVCFVSVDGTFMLSGDVSLIVRNDIYKFLMSIGLYSSL